MFHVEGTKTSRGPEQRGAEWTYDATGGSLTTLLADAIAEYKGVDPLKPDFSLYDSIDTEALDELLASVSGTEFRTEFRIEGVTVRVRKGSNDEIVVTVGESTS